MSDVRIALRSLQRSPGFAVATLLTLALTIGANTAMFSFGDATAFRPPDVPRPREIVRVFSVTKEAPNGQHSVPDYIDYRDRTTTLAAVVAYSGTLAAMSRNRDEIPQLFGAWAVSGNFFSALEVEPALGRGFVADDDKPGAPPATVISHSLWNRLFNADPAVLGTPVILGQREFTIVGIAPERFAGTDLFFHPDLYVPISMIRELQSSRAENVLRDRSSRWLNILGRLRRDVDVATANAEMLTLAGALEDTYSETNKGRTVEVLPEVSARGRLDTIGYQGAGVAILIVALVLLIACANVANLMLSRAAGRTREFAVRLAIGASRGRLVRQLLIESLVLATAGGVLGMAMAYAGIQFLSGALAASFAMTDMPIFIDARLDTRVLLFTFAASTATGLLFGLTPALQSARLNLIPALKTSVTVDRRRRAFTQRHVLVAGEITLAIVVLTVAGMSIRGFVSKRSADPGFRTDHVLLMSVNPGLVNYSEQDTRQFYKEALERVKSLPGVTSAGLAEFVPLAFNGGSSFLHIDGYDGTDEQSRASVGRNIVDEGYWRVLRTPLVRGRVFDERDTSSSPGVMVINETMAQRYWPNQDPIGKTVHLRDRNGPIMQIVGIVRDGKYNFLGEPQQPFIFMPASQRFRSMMTIVVLGAGDPAALAAPIRAELKEIGSDVPLFDIRTYDDVFQSRALLFSRLTTQVFTWLGFLALVLAALGIYSVIAYLTTLRTREIGIRTAVGADRRSILLLISRETLPMIGPGLLAGTALAYFATSFLAVPFDLSPNDPATLAAVVTVFTVIALTAALIPARRAARVDPLVALRYE